MEFESYIPTNVIFGPGSLNKLADINLPGKKALICITEDNLMEKLGILEKVTSLLKKAHIEFEIFNKVTPNPTRKGVMDAASAAKETNCDFFIGLGGGSSIDTAKAASIMMVNEGDLWDYAQTGTGKKQEIKGSYPIVTITTTAGTGTECDPWCVITNEETHEKLDFGTTAAFPVVSIIDPQLMLTLPKTLTIYQGFDGLFHAVECYLATCGSPLAKLYSMEAIKIFAEYLPKVAENSNNLEARCQISYAANVLCGFAQSLSATISPHIIGQCMSGLFPEFTHGATLIVTAEEYYRYVIEKNYMKDEFKEMGKSMGNEDFLSSLIDLLDKTGVRYLPMSKFGVKEDDLSRIAEISYNIGFDFDPYKLTKEDVFNILKKSYR